MSTPVTQTSTSADATTAPSNAPPTNILGKDDFLKIFLAQLSQQDPTSPVDSTAFVAQLAQFSSLELQQNANTDLESLMMGQAAAQQTSVTNLVGKDVTFNSNSLALTSGQGTTINAGLATAAANLTAVISDATGKAVRTIKVGANAAGPVSLGWDGRDDQGNTLPSGTYQVAITAAGVGGASVAVTQTQTGEVTGISFAGGTTQLIVGASTVQLSTITQITERTTP
jgi:flagellar basal-body rod modification protein FlgD